MKISDSYKVAINNAFRRCIFYSREKENVLNILHTLVHGSSNVTIIPPIQGLELEKIDDTHDKATFIFDDYTFVGIITWKLSSNGKNIVFIKIE